MRFHLGSWRTYTCVKPDSCTHKIQSQFYLIFVGKVNVIEFRYQSFSRQDSDRHRYYKILSEEFLLRISKFASIAMQYAMQLNMKYNNCKCIPKLSDVRERVRRTNVFYNERHFFSLTRIGTIGSVLRNERTESEIGLDTDFRVLFSSRKNIIKRVLFSDESNRPYEKQKDERKKSRDFAALTNE